MADQTLAQLCVSHNVKMEVVPVFSDMANKALNYIIRLSCRGQSLETKYSRGIGYIKTSNMRVGTIAYDELINKVLRNPTMYSHQVEPVKVEDVVACLFSDASAFEGSRDLEDFASNYGGKIRSIADAKKIEQSYMICAETSKKLRIFFNTFYDVFAEAASNY